MGKTVLVVDDSEIMRQMVSYTLREAGFDVVEGENGQEGLDRLDSNAVQLVITDVNMPVMDGITFVKRLRERPALKFLPVLILTTESQGAKKQEGKAAGATGWIVKPFEPNKLLKVIGKVLP